MSLDDGNPNIVYFSDRKGWHAYSDSLDVGYLEALGKEEARYFVGRITDLPESMMGRLEGSYKPVWLCDRWFIFDLERE